MSTTIKLETLATKREKDWSAYLRKQEGKTIAFGELASYPYTAIGKLFIHEGKGRHQFGTAFKVAPNVLMTAAHCLANVVEERAYPYSDITYCPLFPYHDKAYTAIGLSIPDNYIAFKHTEHDYGFIIFDTELPRHILPIDPNPAKTGTCFSIGYPDSYQYFGDKMIQAYGKYDKPYLQEMMVMVGNDMRSGCSGGPIIDGKSGKVISLNSSNWGDNNNKEMSGPMMRNEILAALNELMGELSINNLS